MPARRRPADGATFVDDDGAREPAVAAASHPVPSRATPQQVRWCAWAAGLVLLPFLVSAVVTLAKGSGFWPISDYALTELQVRDVLRHPVLNGLFSRDDWRHPGPLFFYVVAPFSWIVGRASVGMNLAALAVNGVSVAGIAWVCWRRGRAEMLLCGLLGCALVMRTMGASFLNDPWNNFVVTLPYGLLLFCCWSLACGDRWALPVATVAATFVAQTHVGFIVLALPLLAASTGWLLVSAWRRGSPREHRRAVMRTFAVSVGLGLVLWSPVLVDVLVNDPSNLGRIMRYFRHSDDQAQTFATGWNIVSAQFAAIPEWLTSKRTDIVGYGESPFKAGAPFPLLLVLAVAAGVTLWVRRGTDAVKARYFACVIALAFVLGVAGVLRTLGPALDYRLRWTWMLPLAGFVLVLWTAWQLVVDRWPGTRQAVLVVVGALVVVISGINVISAATVPAPWKSESDVMAAIVPKVRDHLDLDGGQVLLTDRIAGGRYTRGLVLALERDGFDARVPATHEPLFGTHRVADETEPVQARLYVGQGAEVQALLESPEYELIARWRPAPGSAHARALAQRDVLERRYRAGRMSQQEYLERVAQVLKPPPAFPLAEDLAVFERTPPAGTAPP